MYTSYQKYFLLPVVKFGFVNYCQWSASFKTSYIPQVRVTVWVFFQQSGLVKMSSQKLISMYFQLFALMILESEVNKWLQEAFLTCVNL